MINDRTAALLDEIVARHDRIDTEAAAKHVAAGLETLQRAVHDDNVARVLDEIGKAAERADAEAEGEAVVTWKELDDWRKTMEWLLYRAEEATESIASAAEEMAK